MSNRLIVLLFICLISGSSLAAVKTNVNEVNDLFDRHIDNKAGLFREMELQNQKAATGIGSGEGQKLIPSIDGASSISSELNAIKEIDLDREGNRKRTSKEYSFFDENELEPDYSKAGNRTHKEDAENIASSTSKLLGDLMLKLKEIGVDCKAVRGAVQKEPIYHIELTRTAQKHTEYDQFFCEEPRNRYHCTDSVSLRCAKTGKRYGEWQDREIAFDGAMLYWQHTDWGWSEKHADKYHIWYIHKDHPKKWFWFGGSESSSNSVQINEQARQLIATKLGVALEQIGETITFPNGGEGIGRISPLYSRWRQAWEKYVFKYKYRDAYKTCEEWHEDWTEQCRLQ